MTKIGNIELGDCPLLLAPMEDVTDPSFRILCKRLGADVVYSEFISSDGLARDIKSSLKKMTFSEVERPIGIQIFGSNIEAMKPAVEAAEKVNPDLIDLNFGCPVNKIVGKGCCAGLLKDIPKMIAITEEVVKSTNLPVTAKTRLGWDEDSKNIVDIAERLQDTGIKALTIHGRTRSQLYKGEADWTLIGEVKNNPRMNIPIIGNGDIDSPVKAEEARNKYGVDGIMIGRAAIGNPWIFRSIKHYFNTHEILPEPTLKEKIEIVKEHLRNSYEWKGDKRGIYEMRKHYSTYFKGIPNFKSKRLRLVTSMDIEEMMDLLDEILNWDLENVDNSHARVVG